LIPAEPSALQQLSVGDHFQQELCDWGLYRHVNGGFGERGTIVETLRAKKNPREGRAGDCERNEMGRWTSYPAHCRERSLDRAPQGQECLPRVLLLFNGSVNPQWMLC
jgi:hypothetical protein